MATDPKILATFSKYVHIVHVIAETIANSRAKMSALLKQVQAGEIVVVLDHGTPVARIEAVTSWSDENYALMAKTLVRSGDLLPKRKPLDDTFFELPMSDDKEGKVLSALLEERREGR